MCSILALNVFLKMRRLHYSALFTGFLPILLHCLVPIFPFNLVTIFVWSNLALNGFFKNASATLQHAPSRIFTHHLKQQAHHLLILSCSQVLFFIIHRLHLVVFFVISRTPLATIAHCKVSFNSNLLLSLRLQNY